MTPKKFVDDIKFLSRDLPLILSKSFHSLYLNFLGLLCESSHAWFSESNRKISNKYLSIDLLIERGSFEYYVIFMRWVKWGSGEVGSGEGKNDVNGRFKPSLVDESNSWKQFPYSRKTSQWRHVTVKCSPGDVQLYLYFVRRRFVVIFCFLQTMQTHLIGFCSLYKDTGLEAYDVIL